MPNETAGRSDRLPLLLILIAIGTVFAPSLANGFTYDDGLYVRAETERGTNVMVKSVQPLTEYFSVPYGYPQARQSRGFRPITVLSLALTRAAFVGDGAGDGDPAWPHHLVNVLLHVLAAWLAYVVVRRLTGPGWPPLLAAAVFGVHALRSDAVIAIVGRGEILAFAFGLIALVSYLQAQGGASRPVLRYVVAAVALFLALGSKEGALGWAVMLPIFGVVAGRDGPGAAVAAVKRQVLPFLATVTPPVVVFFLLRHAMLTEHGHRFLVTFNANPLYEAPGGVRVLTGVMLLAHGLWQTFAPFQLACDWGVYVFSLIDSATDVRFLGAAAVLVCLLGLGAWSLRRHGLLALAVAQFFVFAVITANILVRIETIYAERLYYIPAFGASLFVAWATARLTGRTGSARGRNVLFGVVGVWCVVSAGLCVKRCFDWRDTETLILADVDGQPRSLFLNLQAAGIHDRRGDRGRRDQYLERARRLDPRSPWVALTTAQYRLRAGDVAGAAELFGKVLASPRMDAAERPVVRQNLAAIQLQLGRRVEAEANYNALRDADDPALAHSVREALLWMAHEDADTAAAEDLVAEGRRDLARITAADARALAEANYRLFDGLLAHRRGEYTAAVRELGGALSVLERRRSDPQRMPAVFAYIESLAASGDTDGARQMTDNYLRSPNLLPDHRPKLEALARRFGKR